MSDGLSRRELVAVIGAGMAVSACTAKDDGAGRNGTHKRDPLNKDTCGNEGLNPHDKPPAGSMNPSTFKTDYIAILCIELGDNWSMTINHGNFSLGANEKDDPGREKKALVTLSESWKDEAKPRKQFKENNSHNPRNRKDGSVDDHSNFEKFRFNQPIELFIYIYQRNIGGSKSILPDGRLLSFGPYMQQLNGNNVPFEATDNCSYFRARLVNLSDYKKLDKHGFMFRVENWSRKADGTMVGTAEVLHSMNIHFSIPLKDLDGNEIRMPMVFDPDTGNGTGNEP
jgi:hypothetical protein